MGSNHRPAVYEDQLTKNVQVKNTQASSANLMIRLRNRATQVIASSCMVFQGCEG